MTLSIGSVSAGPSPGSTWEALTENWDAPPPRLAGEERIICCKVMTPHQSPRTQVIESVLIHVASLQNQMLAGKGDVGTFGCCHHPSLLSTCARRTVILDVQTLHSHAELGPLFPGKVCQANLEGVARSKNPEELENTSFCYRAKIKATKPE